MPGGERQCGSRAALLGVAKGLNQAGAHFSLQYIVKGLVILVAVYTDVRRRKEAER